MKSTLFTSVLLVLSSTLPSGGNALPPTQLRLSLENGRIQKINSEQNAETVDSMRLLAISEKSASWTNPEQLIADGQQFMDITDHPDLDGPPADRIRQLNKRLPVPSGIQHNQTVHPILQLIDLQRVRERMEKFTSFKNRYYRSETGVQSAEWLEQTLLDIVEQYKCPVKISRFEHSWQKQFSLIARFSAKSTIVTNSDGSSETGDAKFLIMQKKKPLVIIGAHQDTVRGGLFTDGRAPGADDDGSGTMTTLEAFTVLCQSGYLPSADRPIEFHYYSAEEVGLRGSQDIAANYQRDSRPVAGIMHFDMTGYRAPNENAIGVINDYTDKELTVFLRQLIAQYSRLKPVETRCGYACSDHASWTKAGYRSAFPFEGSFSNSSPFIHKKTDTVDNIDFDHLSEFVRLAVGFAVEMSADMK